MNRHARQMMLPVVGADGQARLQAAHVLIVGAGGLGCPVIQYLAGAGVGHLTIIDPDVVELTNLHRQPLYRMDDIGLPKAEVAGARITAIDPQIVVQAITGALDPLSARILVPHADIVIDAADSFAVTYTLSDCCFEHGVPLVSASALGLTGYVGAYCATAPSVRAVFPDLPDRAASCATAGVLGPVVGTIGALQAQMALSLLLGLEPSPAGQMLTLDFGTLYMDRFSFLSASEPDGAVLPFLSREELTAGDLVIELRGAEEAPEPVTPQALRLSPEAVNNWHPNDADRIVFCCKTGLRAWRAAQRLRSRGYDRIALLAVGDA
jgi:molybdopterin/thiamine biosynthesis adenylyltransferase